MKQAFDALKDKKDITYLACAIKSSAIIWSNDNDFKEQDIVEHLNTKEMLEIAGL